MIIWIMVIFTLPRPEKKCLWRLKVKSNSSTRHFWLAGLFILATALAVMTSCTKEPNSSNGAKGTVAEGERFIVDAEKRLLDLNLKYSRADWEKSTNITKETEELSANANKDLIAATTELAEQATTIRRPRSFSRHSAKDEASKTVADSSRA